MQLRNDWQWLRATTLLATALLLMLVVLLACGPKNGAIPPSASAIVYLAWLPHPDTTILGYRVYYSQALDPPETMAMILDTMATEASFDWQRDLDSAPTVCFRLRAYNGDGDGPFTDGICANVRSW